MIPKSQSARTVADAARPRLPGGQGASPITIVTDARARPPRIAARVEQLPGVRSVSEPRALDDGDLTQIDVLADRATRRARRPATSSATIRDDAGIVLVGGAAAEFIDQQDAIGSQPPARASGCWSG